MNTVDKSNRPAPVYVVSGGKGLAGNNMVQSLLIQYPDNQVPVIIVPDILDEKKLEAVILQAKKDGGLITHTMVNPVLRKRLIELAANHGVQQIDFMGQFADYLDKTLGIPSLQYPGLYRELNHQYFDRIDAMEFTLEHDDGLSMQRLTDAEIVLCGVSRTGKTPLSVYLALYGWKVANVPLVPGIDPPDELFKIDPQRVFGLQIGVPQLIAHRIKRLRSFNNLDNHAYVDERQIKEEIRYANLIFARGKFTLINVTNKPVESSANEIINTMTSRFQYGGRRIKSPFLEPGEPNDSNASSGKSEEEELDLF
ncbi:pyruvate, water dikinase regulatory protein [Gaoshiqia sp. Z1-71]|uniref:pyruvate, water dikinase regulatory protein n=1 Tax=Gaoshiqia hydrogeniformans TaxID=3290090 RepID=UPI003BF8CFD3